MLPQPMMMTRPVNSASRDSGEPELAVGLMFASS
jgi:hypothetical protein